MRRMMNITPRRGGRLLLGLLPFVLIAFLYVAGSAERRAVNPDDKLLPPVSEMAAAIKRAAFAPLIGVLSMIPPMAVLPILFIVFGLGELSKVVLIVFGIAPFLVRDLALAINNMPVEQLVKAQTLGASTWQVAIRVVLPQIMPRLIEAVRLSIGPAFLFLIAAEAIAAENGLGYRIFLLRRYLAMDTILPYVAWITLLAWLLDAALAALARRAFAFAYVTERR